NDHFSPIKSGVYYFRFRSSDFVIRLLSDLRDPPARANRSANSMPTRASPPATQTHVYERSGVDVAVASTTGAGATGSAGARVIAGGGGGSTGAYCMTAGAGALVFSGGDTVVCRTMLSSDDLAAAGGELVITTIAGCVTAVSGGF